MLYYLTFWPFFKALDPDPEYPWIRKIPTQIKRGLHELEFLGAADEPDKVLQGEVDDDNQVHHVDGVDEGGVVVVTKLIVLVIENICYIIDVYINMV